MDQAKQQPRWQRARIKRPDFDPPSDVGRLIWVRNKPPEHAIIIGEVTHRNGTPERTDSPVEADWYLTNQTFQNVQLRVSHEDVELVADFADSVEMERVEDRA